MEQATRVNFAREKREESDGQVGFSERRQHSLGHYGHTARTVITAIAVLQILISGLC